MPDKHSPNNPKARQTKLRPIPTVSAVFEDGAILETVYRPGDRRTKLRALARGELDF